MNTQTASLAYKLKYRYKIPSQWTLLTA